MVTGCLRDIRAHGEDAQRRRSPDCAKAEDTARGAEGRRDAAPLFNDRPLDPNDWAGQCAHDASDRLDLRDDKVTERINIGCLS